jgi:hypothetical protein
MGFSKENFRKISWILVLIVLLCFIVHLLIKVININRELNKNNVFSEQILKENKIKRDSITFYIKEQDSLQIVIKNLNYLLSVKQNNYLIINKKYEEIIRNLYSLPVDSQLVFYSNRVKEYRSQSTGFFIR